MRFQFLCLFLLLISSCARGPEDIDTRARRLGSQIRCPVCRGVPISESPSTLAQEMMDLVRQEISKGKSDQEILLFFEERYGEWALLRPKPIGMNLVLWVMPALVLLAGGIFIFFRVRKEGE